MPAGSPGSRRTGGLFNVRREGKNNRNRWLHLRLNEDEYQSLQKQYSATADRKLSDFARARLLDKAVRVIHRNGSLDALVEELALVKRELSAAGNNFNQAVKKSTQWMAQARYAIGW